MKPTDFSRTNMNTRKIIAAFLCSVISTALWATDCSKMETQSDLNRCYGVEYKAADKELNQAYADVRASLDERQKQELKAVQLAWIKYRDLSCNFELSNAKGGSAYSMGLSICLTEKTRARTAELKKMASCEEGDITCSPK